MCSYICSPWRTQVPLAHLLSNGTTKVTKCPPESFLGDLTLKGEKCGSKQVSPKGEECLPNGGEIMGKSKGEIMDLGGGQADIG